MTEDDQGDSVMDVRIVQGDAALPASWLIQSATKERAVWKQMEMLEA